MLLELLVVVELLRWLAASLFVIIYPATRQQLWAMSCRQRVARNVGSSVVKCNAMQYSSVRPLGHRRIGTDGTAVA